jgi:hypothetical protein
MGQHIRRCQDYYRAKIITARLDQFRLSEKQVVAILKAQEASIATAEVFTQPA